MQGNEKLLQNVERPAARWVNDFVKDLFPVREVRLNSDD